MYDGIMNVYKEPGFTSFDVVAKLRGILKQKKIGHTGTLDPQAEGVLVVCLGNATKLVEILPDHEKEYEAVALLGTETDTYDAEGTVLRTTEVSLSEDRVREAVDSFVGGYRQVPPMYSAIKVDGQKLYDLARKGITIEREPRPVTIDAIEILEMDLPRVRMRIRCGRGTYIRSLIHDIGEKLGVGGCMEHLTRTVACGFSAEDALTLREIEALRDCNQLASRIHTVPDVFPDSPKLTVTEACNRLLLNGNCFSVDGVAWLQEDTLQGEKGADHFLVYGSDDIFRGIYDYDPVQRIFKPYKMFL